jgi:uncharacterized membrane protein
MSGWNAKRAPDRSARAVIALAVIALALVILVPVALLAAVVLMLLGSVVAGLAVFGGSVLAAVIAVVLAGMGGMRHMRKLLSGASARVVRLNGSQYADVTGDRPDPAGSDHAGNVVQLDRSDYTDVS